MISNQALVRTAIAWQIKALIRKTEAKQISHDVTQKLDQSRPYVASDVAHRVDDSKEHQTCTYNVPITNPTGVKVNGVVATTNSQDIIADKTTDESITLASDEDVNDDKPCQSSPHRASWPHPWF